MPNIETYKLTRKEIESIRIPPGSRKCLIKTISRNVDERTKSGIWVISEMDTDWAENVHVDRWGELISAPTHLPFEIGGDLMPWQTRVQVSKGMKVWYDYMASLNTVVYVDEDKSEYRLIDYDCLYVATVPRCEEEDFWFSQKSTDGKEWIIPLNGFHIFERIFHEPKSKFDIHITRKVNNKEAIVRYVAVNNKAYETDSEEDHIELEPGDRVTFGTVPAVMLEDEAHCKFDGARMYRRAQARNIDLVWRGDDLILPKGRILIKRIPDEMVRPSGVILLREKVKNHRGTVVLSSIEGVEVGQTVIYPIKGGVPMDYKGEDGHRILRDVQILYIE